MRQLIPLSGRQAKVVAIFGSLDPARIELALRAQRAACLRQLFDEIVAQVAALRHPITLGQRWLPLLNRRIR